MNSWSKGRGRWTGGVALAALMVAGLAVEARAATETATLTARVEVVSTCTISDAELDFGTYVAGQSGDLDATATLEITECPVASVEVEFDGGGSGNVKKRQMRDGNGNVLSYQIYTDAGMSRVAGEGRSGRSLSLGNNNGTTLTVYARIPGGQVVPEGTYTDTVRVTMSF